MGKDTPRKEHTHRTYMAVEKSLCLCSCYSSLLPHFEHHPVSLDYLLTSASGSWITLVVYLRSSPGLLIISISVILTPITSIIVSYPNCTTNQYRFYRWYYRQNYTLPFSTLINIKIWIVVSLKPLAP